MCCRKVERRSLGGLAMVGLGVAMLSSIIPYLLEMRAFRARSPGVAGILLSSAPAISAIVGVVVLKEKLSERAWAAVAMVVISSAGCAVSSCSDLGKRQPHRDVVEATSKKQFKVVNKHVVFF